MYKISFISCLFAIVVLLSCKKFVDAEAPSDVITDENAFNSDATAISVVNGIYTNMSKATRSGIGGFTGVYGISGMCGLAADELSLFSGVSYQDLIDHYENRLSVDEVPATGGEHWAPLYNYIYQCNAALEGLNAGSLTESIKRQLLGEASFLRSFFYFYLVNLFGDVPLVLSTDYTVNATLPRTAVAEVYGQIISDLLRAQELLGREFPGEGLAQTTEERVRPTYWAATALLARVYLYNNNFASARDAATSVIANTALFDLTPLNEVFLKNSRETIWQLQPVDLYLNTHDGLAFVITSTGLNDNNPVHLSSFLADSFETGDERRYNRTWIDSVIVEDSIYYFPFKYKAFEQDLDITVPSAMTEYLMVLRLAELFLIRAEAYARQGDITAAQNDLNQIRLRAGLPPTAAADQASLLQAVMQERKRELFTEWGHRWLDLKRTGLIDAVMTVVTPQKANGKGWLSYQQLFPIPPEDLVKAGQLTQNPGY